MSTEAILRLNQACIKQGDNVILDEVELLIKKGDFQYLIGSTGSGKSSLLKTLYGDLPLSSGTGHVCGINLVNLKEKQIPALRRKLGIVFQDFQLLTDRSVFDNLKFVLQATGWKSKTDIKKKIEEVLTKVNMESLSAKMPFQLSGGEQQRVSIARALLNDPELILADEPTGNLDPSTSEEIMILLEEISNSGRALLMATHDYSLILKFPHETLKCSQGKVFSTVQNTL
ncbi:MAG: phosphonate ABC transporter ATP-binding protein [Bacteroidetes bacterium]|nr:MAG: phosphonate ABC transporter ATP-binding protein [Bacteroidota bacterium]